MPRGWCLPACIFWPQNKQQHLLYWLIQHSSLKSGNVPKSFDCSCITNYWNYSLKFSCLQRNTSKWKTYVTDKEHELGGVVWYYRVVFNTATAAILLFVVWKEMLQELWPLCFTLLIAIDLIKILEISFFFCKKLSWEHSYWCAALCFTLHSYSCSSLFPLTKETGGCWEPQPSAGDCDFDVVWVCPPYNMIGPCVQLPGDKLWKSDLCHSSNIHSLRKDLWWTWMSLFSVLQWKWDANLQVFTIVFGGRWMLSTLI